MSRIGNAMTLERLLTILDAYGADPARWPEAERAAALAALRLYAQEAGPALAAAREADALLALDRDETPLNEFAARRIVKAAPKALSLSAPRPLAALAACAALGLAIGLVSARAAPNAAAADAILAEAFDAGFGEPRWPGAGG